MTNKATASETTWYSSQNKMRQGDVFPPTDWFSRRFDWHKLVDKDLVLELFQNGSSLDMPRCSPANGEIPDVSSYQTIFNVRLLFYMPTLLTHYCPMSQNWTEDLNVL